MFAGQRIINCFQILHKKISIIFQPQNLINFGVTFYVVVTHLCNYILVTINHPVPQPVAAEGSGNASDKSKFYNSIKKRCHYKFMDKVVVISFYLMCGQLGY